MPCCMRSRPGDSRERQDRHGSISPTEQEQTWDTSQRRMASTSSTGLGPRDAQVIFFHHGWPLSADDWDAQMLFFLGQGYRVIAHDRRGHGRSSQVWDGHDMDHYADDVAAVVNHLGARRRSCRPFDRRRRGDPLRRPSRRRPRRQGRADQRRSAADGQDGQQSGRPAEGRVRQPPGNSRRTVRSSTTTCPPARSTAITATARSRRKASSGTGGGRA